MTHRTRLLLTTSAASGILLAIVFVGMYWFSRSLQISGARNVLDAGLNQLVDDLKTGERPDLKEVHEAYPRASFAVFDSQGRLLEKQGAAATPQRLGVHIASSSGGTWLSEGIEKNGRLLIGGLDWSASQAELDRLITVLALVWLLVQGVVAGVTWYAAGATFRPLHELTNQAASLSGRDLALRLDSSDTAEFGEFVEKLNLLLERIERTAIRERQFAADAAHELRTPLATLVASLDTALLKERTNAEYKATLKGLVPETLRLTQLVELLLSSARSEFEAAESIDLTDVVASTVSGWKERFDDHDVKLVAELTPAQGKILPNELRSVLDNLLENALRTSPRGGKCVVEMEGVNSHCVVRVRDEGPGVPEMLLPSLFDRFTTGQPSRTRDTGGYGIGLSICRNIVVARGGKISARNLDRGAEFSVELP